MPLLLVVDDEPAILDSFRFAFAPPEFTLVTAAAADEAVDLFQKQTPDVVISDIQLPGRSGLELFETLHQLDARVPIILMTGHGTASTAIEAMRRGAFEYLLKPLDLDTLIPAVESALETSRLMRTPTHLPTEDRDDEQGDPLIGDCLAMQQVYRAIGRVAPQDVTVLILGESGTGKEVVARAIYQYSRRASQRFMAINCAAIPEQLLESELFGHEKGSFTGADRKRIGRFEQCNGGTLFLDEIGDMPLLMQTKILRVLQDRQFERVGGSETISSDVRLIAATNRNLEAMIAAGDFRGDLYYRLNVYTINIPPLRERGDDIERLAMHFCRRFARELEKDFAGLAEETIELLKRYEWPGNVRELQSVLKHALLEATCPLLTPAFLPGFVRASSSEVYPESIDAVGRELGQPPSVEDSNSTATRLDGRPNRLGSCVWDDFLAQRLAAGSESLYADAIHYIERELFTRVLQHTGGNQQQAARLLGITRTTFRGKLREHGITIDRLVTTEDG